MTIFKNNGFFLKEALLALFIFSITMPVFTKYVVFTLSKCSEYSVQILLILDTFQMINILKEDSIKSSSIEKKTDSVWMSHMNQTIIYKIKNNRLHRQILGKKSQYITDILICTDIDYVRPLLIVTTSKERFEINTFQ